MSDLVQKLLEHHKKMDTMRDFGVVSITFRWKGKDITCHGLEYNKILRYINLERTSSGKEHLERHFELVGMRPPFMQNRTRRGEQKNVIRMPGDEGDWYVGCHYEGPPDDTYHPVGPTFTLSRWPHEKFGYRIDHNSELKRNRVRVVNLHVEYT